MHLLLHIRVHPTLLTRYKASFNIIYSTKAIMDIKQRASAVLWSIAATGLISKACAKYQSINDPSLISEKDKREAFIWGSAPAHQQHVAPTRITSGDARKVGPCV